MRQRLAQVLTLVMLVPSVTVLSASARLAAWEPAAPPPQRSVPGTTIASRAVPVPKSATGQNAPMSASVMPGPIDTVVAVGTAGEGWGAATPVAAGPPARGGGRAGP